MSIGSKFFSTINKYTSLSFSKLSNFLIVSPSNNQLIYYNNSAGIWENTLINSSFLSDFNIVSPTANQILQYICGKWINSTLNFTSTLSGDTDVNISNLSSGQVLQNNGSKGINLTSSMGSSTLASYSDVYLSNLINGQLLKYNGTNWINSAMSLEMNNDVNVSSLPNKNILK